MKKKRFLFPVVLLLCGLLVMNGCVGQPATGKSGQKTTATQAQSNKKQQTTAKNQSSKKEQPAKKVEASKKEGPLSLIKLPKKGSLSKLITTRNFIIGGIILFIGIPAVLLLFKKKQKRRA